MASPAAGFPGHGRQWRWLSRLTTFPWAIGSLVSLGVFATVRDTLADPDIFWHLRNGQYILTHHRLVTSDLYSFTVNGQPWVSHEWLSEILYYSVYRGLGWQGIVALYSLLTIAVVLGVYALAIREGADPATAALLAALGKLMLGVGAGPRMQHLGLLCFIAVFAILQKYRRERSAPLWALPILFCLWINLHGGWASGAVVCVLIVLSGFVPRDLGRLEASPWTKRDIKRLLLAGSASVAALFVHPAGYKAVLYPFQVFTRMPLQQQFVTEWQAVSFGGRLGNYVMLVIAVLFLVAITGKKGWRVDEVLLVLFALYFGLSHQRLLVLSGILLPIILAHHVGSFSSYVTGHERRKLNLAVSCLAVIVIVALFPSRRTAQAEIDETYPAGAVRYIRDHRLTGPMFNFYSWGGYLEWTAPELKTFIDGRGDVFEFHGVLKDYLDAAHLVRTKEVLDQYQIRFVLIPEGPLAYFLENTGGWHRTYTDTGSVIFEKVK